MIDLHGYDGFGLLVGIEPTAGLAPEAFALVKIGLDVVRFEPRRFAHLFMDRAGHRVIDVDAD